MVRRGRELELMQWKRSRWTNKARFQAQNIGPDFALTGAVGNLYGHGWTWVWYVCSAYIQILCSIHDHIQKKNASSNHTMGINIIINMPCSNHGGP
jgi:hypothetical protein